MSNETLDVVIHIRTPLEPAHFEAVACQVRNLEGVVRFEQCQHKAGMVRVVYDAGRIRALTILNRFIRLGFNASLAGSRGQAHA